MEFAADKLQGEVAYPSWLKFSICAAKFVGYDEASKREIVFTPLLPSSRLHSTSGWLELSLILAIAQGELHLDRDTGLA